MIQCQFGCGKTVYRGLMKNKNRLYAMFPCANLYSLAIARRKLSPDLIQGKSSFFKKQEDKGILATAHQK